MIEEYKDLANVYKIIYKWLVVKTPGENPGIASYKYYDKLAWNIVRELIIKTEKKENLTNEEREFLRCKYQGKAYRIIEYNPKNKGHICITKTYQSCSRDIEGIKMVPLYGNKLLIELIAIEDTYAIDVFELLCFMIKNELIDFNDMQNYNIKNLERYENEREVVIPMTKNNIVNVSVIDSNGNQIEIIPREKWFRESLY